MLCICGTSALSEVDFLLEIDFLSAIVRKWGREACVGERRRKRFVLVILEDGTIIRLSCESAFVFCSSSFFIFFSSFLKCNSFPLHCLGCFTLCFYTPFECRCVNNAYIMRSWFIVHVQHQIVNLMKDRDW